MARTMTLVEELEIAEFVAGCRRAWPGVDLDDGAFAAYVEARRPPELTAEAWRVAVCASDLYLACACAAGNATALRAFRATFGADLDRALKGTDARGFDDARQVLDQRLFVGPSPKIATYTGRAPLRRWLRVVAGRLALEVVAQRQPLADDWEVAALPFAGDDARLALMKARYRAEYKRAFADALAGLPDRDRTVLAQYHVDKLTIDELGALYDVHRATASRWIVRAEDELRSRMLADLCERLALSPAELPSVTRLVRSQLSLSLARLV